MWSRQKLSRALQMFYVRCLCVRVAYTQHSYAYSFVYLAFAIPQMEIVFFFCARMHHSRWKKFSWHFHKSEKSFSTHQKQERCNKCDKKSEGVCRKKIMHPNCKSITFMQRIINTMFYPKNKHM